MSKVDEKPDIIEYLRDTPLVNMACKRFGISRATYYRWCKEDKYFKEAVDVVLKQGRENINELAKATLIKMIKKENFNATRFWLQNNDEAFRSAYFARNDHKKAMLGATPPKKMTDEEFAELAMVFPDAITPEEKMRIEALEPVVLIKPKEPEVSNRYLNPAFEAEWMMISQKQLTDDELKELLKKYPDLVSWKVKRRLEGQTIQLPPVPERPSV